MSLDFGSLQTEFYSRGFDYLNEDSAGQTRAKRWLNEAYLELCELEPWPFVEQTISQAAPITFTDLRQVLSVVNSTALSRINPEDRRTLARAYVDLTTAGNPSWWYLEGDVLKVYPVSSDTLSVRYLYVPPLLSASGDTPVVPDRFEYLIVDGAVIKGYKDSDKFDLVGALRAEYDRGVDQMRDILCRNLDGPSLIVTVGHDDA